MVSVAPKQVSDIHHTVEQAPKRDQRMKSSEFQVNSKSFYKSRLYILAHQMEDKDEKIILSIQNLTGVSPSTIYRVFEKSFKYTNN